VSQSHGELLWVVVGVEMVNPGVWRKCRSGGWMKGGEDVELVLAGVRIGTLTSHSQTAAPASEVIPEDITFLTWLVVLVVLSDVCSQL